MRYIWGTYRENFIDYTIGWNRKKRQNKTVATKKKKINETHNENEETYVSEIGRWVKRIVFFFYLLESFFRNKYTVSLSMYVCVFVRVSSLSLRIENKTTTTTKNEIQKKNVQPKRLGRTFHPSIHPSGWLVSLLHWFQHLV